MRSNVFFSVALAVASTGFWHHPAWGNACLDEVRTAAGECKGDCREAYQLAKDTCSNRDHVCVEGCRADRQVCLQPTLDVLDAAVDACNATKSAAVATCRANHPDGSVELDTCIDQAQVVAFLCRKVAHKAAKPGIRACRSAFKLCVNTQCPVLGPTDPAAVRACKDDAVGLYDNCKDSCTEAKQLGKDTCLDRDHACVEVCRADRVVFTVVVEAARAVCAATRQAAFDNCRTLYPAGSTDRQICFEQAQVAAFSCRDAAREGVADALRSCSDAFLACAQACPAPGS
jgi:hypothetical protein